MALSHLLSRLTTDFSHDLDKTQFESFTQKRELRGQQDPLFIRFMPDKANRTLSIMHNGTGTSKADLGAIVRSGTKEFRQALQAGADYTSMIDQLSVGFYLAYLVVDKVVVTTKRNDDDHQYKWESHAGGSFSVKRDDNGEQLGRGTKITLFLKEDQLEFLEERKIRDSVKEQPEIINYPIYLWAEKTTRPLDEAGREEEGGGIVEVPYEWQRISEPKCFRAGGPQVEPTTSNWFLCKTIKDILGDKVVDVIIAPESFDDSSSFRFTRKRILEINPHSAILEDLRKVVVETGESDRCVKQLIVKLLFETALSTKKAKRAHSKKWAKGLSVCCSIISAATAAVSCAMSG